MKTITTKQLTYSALMAAIVFVGTMIYIPLSFNGGYIHIGDGFVLLCGILLGPLGALSAGIGSALADIVLGFPQWALPTFIIKFLMALIVAILVKYKENNQVSLIVGITYSAIWIVTLIPLRFALKNALSTSAKQFLVELNSERITTTSYLLKLGHIYDITLLLTMIIVPLLIITFTILHRKGLMAIRPIEGISFIISGTLMIILYYFVTAIMYGNFIQPIMDIIPNHIQFIIGIIIVNLLYPITNKIKQQLKV